MSNDIDSVSAELTKELAQFQYLEKALPPKLKYRFYRWLQQFKHNAAGKQMTGQSAAIQAAVKSAHEEIAGLKELKKNEAQASFYDSGMIKMDFGPDVDPKAKEAAMKWAKRKGLQVTEAGLTKSADSFSSITFAPSSHSATSPICVKRVKFIS